jgi:hypothetical protein
MNKRQILATFIVGILLLSLTLPFKYYDAYGREGWPMTFYSPAQKAQEINAGFPVSCTHPASSAHLDLTRFLTSLLFWFVIAFILVLIFSRFHVARHKSKT